jgi:hypothetical protein
MFRSDKEKWNDFRLLFPIAPAPGLSSTPETVNSYGSLWADIAASAISGLKAFGILIITQRAGEDHQIC